MRTSQLYIPTIPYPGKRDVLTDETILHPYGLLPEAETRVNKLLSYKAIPTGGADVSRVLPLLSTGFHFCPALVVRGSWSSGRGLAHVVQHELPDDYIEAMRVSGMQGKLEGVIVICPFDQGKREEFEDRCRSVGLAIMNVIEIPRREDGQAPQTDIIVSPLKKEISIFTEDQIQKNLKF